MGEMKAVNKPAKTGSHDKGRQTEGGRTLLPCLTDTHLHSLPSSLFRLKRNHLQIQIGTLD